MTSAFFLDFQTYLPTLSHFRKTHLPTLKVDVLYGRSLTDKSYEKLQVRIEIVLPVQS